MMHNDDSGVFHRCAGCGEPATHVDRCPLCTSAELARTLASTPEQPTPAPKGEAA